MDSQENTEENVSEFARPGAAETPDPTLPETGLEDRKMSHLQLIIIFGIFATTLPQPQVLGRLPLQHLLKDTLHVDPNAMSQFFFWCGLAWYLKPFAGILTDAFPLFGTRRRHYMLISSVLAAISWAAMSWIPKTYNSLLLGAIVVNLFMVMTSTVTGAYLVEAGQNLKATGRFTAVRQFVSNFCTLVNGPLAGFLASIAFMYTAFANAILVLTLFPVVFIFLKEKPQRVDTAQKLRNAKRQLQTIFTSRAMWFSLLFIALFYFAPGFGTPLYYIQSDTLKFSQQFIGNLGIYAGGAGITAAILYGFLIKKVRIQVLLVSSVIVAASGTLLYLFYKSAAVAPFIEAQNGFFFTMAELAILDLAARATPVGCEGLGYSLMLSIRNLAVFGADIVGSKLYEQLHWPFSGLVFLNSGTTLIVLFLLPFMPAVLMRGKDASQPEAA